MTQHTPGPWRAGRADKVGTGAPFTNVYANVDSESPVVIARCLGDDDLHDKANARLIAAAPEMLENIKDTEAELAGILADPAGIPEPIVDLLGELANRQAVLLARIEGKE